MVGRQSRNGLVVSLIALMLLLGFVVLEGCSSSEDVQTTNQGVTADSEKSIGGQSDGVATSANDDQPDWSKPAETLVAVKNNQVTGKNPFSQRFETPDFPKGMSWINTRPLSKRYLKGKFVILDFWTYCCINCLHVLPDLEYLEAKYEAYKGIAFMGCHSAKFTNEKDAQKVRDAILKYNVQHPVINDD